MRALAVTSAVLFIGLPACSSSQDAAEAEIARIAGKCHLPRGAFVIAGDGKVAFRWAAGTPDDQVQCGIDGLRASPVLKDKLGPMGREDRKEAR